MNALNWWRMSGEGLGVRLAVMLCVLGLVAAGTMGCGGKKTSDGMGPGTEITGDTGDQGQTGGGGSSLPDTDDDSSGDAAMGDRIEDIFFDYDRYELRLDARRVLEANARYLMDNPGNVVLEGHCDERGTNEYNLALGQRRADVVMQYLVELGVRPSRMSTVSYGEERPFAMGSNESAWAENRRVHFVLR